MLTGGLHGSGCSQSFHETSHDDKATRSVVYSTSKDGLLLEIHEVFAEKKVTGETVGPYSGSKNK